MVRFLGLVLSLKINNMIPVRITEAFEVRELPTIREGRCCVELLKPLEYHVGSADSSDVIIVPAGYVTDFASIPRGLWNIFPPLGPWARAAIVHDYICDHLRDRYTSREAARIFKEAMKVLGVPAWKVESMYQAVKHFGPQWGKK